VIGRANQTANGLVAAVWTHDIKKARSVAGRLRTGTVCMNCYNVVNVGAPFGGFKRSWHWYLTRFAGVTAFGKWLFGWALSVCLYSFEMTVSLRCIVESIQKS
jgi:acyl-CoA reductase-like NAD-dependent aldehyde dehydrogenase